MIAKTTVISKVGGLFIITILFPKKETNKKQSSFFIMKSKVKVKLATLVEGYPKAPFSIAATPRCRGG